MKIKYTILYTMPNEKGIFTAHHVADSVEVALRLLEKQEGRIESALVFLGIIQTPEHNTDD
jgi:hypothetical protein